jgi:hypothetical protein
VPSRGWSVLDGLALAVLLALAVARASLPLSHDDLFGHLRTGEWIVEHREVPLADPFSYTRPGERWITHEWGFSLAAWGIWRAGGYPGLIAARVLLVLAIGLLVGRRMLAEAGTPRSLPWLAALLGLGLWAVAGELILRAALVSELLLALTLLFLTRYRQTGERRCLTALPAVFLLWGNLHSGVIFGLYILGLRALEALLRRRPARPYLVALGASAAASLLNPNGIEVWLYPWRLSRILFASGIAWDLGHFAAASPLGNPAFLLLLALLLAGLVPPRRLRALSLAETLGIATFLVLTFRTPRFVFHFAVLALPAIYRLLVDREWSPAFRRTLATGVPAVIALAAATVWMDHPRRLLHPRFPEGAVRFLEAEGIRGRVFNHQNFGGFLLWRARAPVFWDGRNDVFAPLVREVTTTPFPQIADRYGIDVLLITEREYQGLLPLIPSRWGLVHWDDDGALYLRRNRFAPFLARRELRLFPGFGGRPGLEQLARDPRLAPAAFAELDRVLSFGRENQRALYFRGVLHLYRGDLESARRDLQAALSIRDNEQVRKALEVVEGTASTPRRTS